MSYTHFDTRITERCGVVCENWPLPKFCPPGDFSSRAALQILYEAWRTDSARFKKLSQEEFQLWKHSRDQLQAQARPPMSPSVHTPLHSIAISERPVFSPISRPIPQTSTSEPIPFSTFVWPPPEEPDDEVPPTPSPSTPNSPLRSGSPLRVESTETANPLAPITTPTSPPFQLGSSAFWSGVLTFQPSSSLSVPAGNGQLVVKKPRKERNDKGKKRGPRKAQPAVPSDSNAGSAPAPPGGVGPIFGFTMDP